MDEDTVTIEKVSGTEDELVILDYDEQTTFILHGSPSLEEGMKVMAIYVEIDGDLLAKTVTTRIPAVDE